MSVKKIFKQIKDYTNKAQALDEEMQNARHPGESGGGAVKIIINGKGKIISLKFADEVFKPEEKELFADLIVVAYNNAYQKIAQQEEQMFSAFNNII